MEIISRHAVTFSKLCEIFTLWLHHYRYNRTHILHSGKKEKEKSDHEQIHAV